MLNGIQLQISFDRNKHLGLFLKARVNQAILIKMVFNHSECHRVTAGDKIHTSENSPPRSPTPFTDGSLGKEGGKKNFKRFHPFAGRPGCKQLLRNESRRDALAS